MKQIIVTYKNKPKIVKTLVQNTLQWYDPIKKEMQYFEGGQLQFEYKEDEYLVSIGNNERLKQNIHSTFRMLPVVTELESIGTSYCLDDKLFVKFFDNYLNSNVSNVTVELSQKKYVLCFVPDAEFEDFSYQLERQGFNYEIS